VASPTYTPHAKAYQQAWNARNREKRREYGRRNYQKNKAKTLARSAQWWKEHPEKKNAKSAKYRAKNPEKAKAAIAAWAARNPEKIRAYRLKRNAYKRGATVNDLTTAQWKTIKEYYGHRCVYCGKKKQRLTQDHITPLSKGGSHTLHNVVPACGTCNSRKGNRAPLHPVQPLLIA
jgi:predicted restriction endonuclease